MEGVLIYQPRSSFQQWKQHSTTKNKILRVKEEHGNKKHSLNKNTNESGKKEIKDTTLVAQKC